MAVVGASWALAQTSTDVLKVGVGVLQAATSDNVQPLALLATESFGAMIPMSHESKAKAYQLCTQDQSSMILNFFKAQIGYQRGDSGWQLSRTDAGLRFLGLAICLLSMNHWQAAEILQKCIDATASDKRLVPTSQHLKQLLVALQPRLAHANFIDNVIAWGSWLSQQDRFKGAKGVHSSTPAPSIIKEIIQAISQVFRIGEVDETSNVEIFVHLDQAAWTIAFLKWSLGCPPNVVNKDRSSVMEVPASRVVLVVILPSDSYPETSKVQIVDSIGGIHELISFTTESSLRSEVRGMCRVSSFCQAQIREDTSNFDVIKLVLPYVCHSVMARLRVVNDIPESEQQGEDTRMYRTLARKRESLDVNGSTSEPVLREVGLRVGSLLPDMSTIARAMQKFLGSSLDPPVSLKSVMGNQVLSLPPIASLRRVLATECKCKACYPMSIHGYMRCLFDVWVAALARTVVTILLIALVEHGGDEEILVHYQARFSAFQGLHKHKALTRVVEECIKNDNDREVSTQELISATLSWVGHKVSPDDVSHWVMSAGNGQTIYPRLLDDLHVSRAGLLSFRCLPGSIVWKKTSYDLVKDGTMNPGEEPVWTDETAEIEARIASDQNSQGWKSSGVSVYEGDTAVEADQQQAMAPQDLHPSFQVKWQVSVHDKHLNVSAGAPKLLQYLSRRPLGAINAAANSLFVECYHDSMSPLNEPVEDLQIVSPESDKFYDSEWEVHIIMSDGNEAARYFSMCSELACIVRNDACLQCCIDVCRLVGVRRIVC